LDLDERRKRILGTAAQATASLMDQQIEKQRTFRQRYQALQGQHTQELTGLSLQYTMELERELARPIHDVDALLRESTIDGHEHKYAQAKAAYHQAARKYFNPGVRARAAIERESSTRINCQKKSTLEFHSEFRISMSHSQNGDCSLPALPSLSAHST
jgi:hypothetical protein